MPREKPDHEFVFDKYAILHRNDPDACGKRDCGRSRSEHITLGELIRAIEDHRSVRYGDRTPDYTVDIKLYEFAGVR